MTFWDGEGALIALQNFLQRHPMNNLNFEPLNRFPKKSGDIGL
jgi:hypothetical protein